MNVEHRVSLIAGHDPRDDLYEIGHERRDGALQQGRVAQNNVLVVHLYQVARLDDWTTRINIQQHLIQLIYSSVLGTSVADWQCQDALRIFLDPKSKPRIEYFSTERGREGVGGLGRDL